MVCNSKKEAFKGTMAEGIEEILSKEPGNKHQPLEKIL